MSKPNFPLPVDTTPEDDGLYLGISRQDLKFHQAICELTDNAISATREEEFFVIEIHIEKNGDHINLKVADDGIGISLDDIQSRILRMGGRGSHKGKLNEHGFGLKNSICVLTGNQRGFTIVTRDKEAVENELIYLVKGPFKRDMHIIEGTEQDWQEGIFKCRGKTGTRVCTSTTMHYFRTLYPSAFRFDSLMERLLEHIGVAYRSYLTNTRNEIWLRWRDVTDGATNWNDEKILPVEIPYLKAQEETFDIHFNGHKYRAFYKWGELDSSVVEDGSRGRPYPLKIYYQRNQKTQGVDINVRGRIIVPHTLEYLWPDMNRHNEFNSFVGELRIDDEAFSTVNNKTELDPNNALWEMLLERIQEEEYKPERTTASFTEKEIRKKLLKKLPSIVSGSTAQDNFPTWPGLGVKIDIHHSFPSGEQQIYELKAGIARPIDVYQLVMYWDGRVEEGVRPKLGRLVASDASQHILNLISYWNSRKDKGGINYNLEFKKIDELL